MALFSSAASFGSSMRRRSWAAFSHGLPRLRAARPRRARASPASVRGIGEQRREAAQVLLRRPVGADRVDHRVELGEFAREGHEGLRVGPGIQRRRDDVVAGEDGVRGVRAEARSTSDRNTMALRRSAASAGRSVSPPPARVQLLADAARRSRPASSVEQHRLHRADGGRRHGQRAEAEADQRHGLERPAADLAADRDGQPAASACSATSCRARSDGRAQRVEAVRRRMRFSRSAAKRNCIRSFEPTERKSALAQISSIWNSSEGTSTMTPSFRSRRQVDGRGAARWVFSRSTIGLGARRTRRRSPPSGT